MTDTLDWQTRVGDVWAAEWRRTDRSLADLSRHLDAAIRAAAPATGTVLDIGCGAGATTLALSTARSDLAITGIDLSPALVAIARTRVPAAAFHVADAARDPLAIAPDLIVSRHGVMFFADPVAAFARLRAHARPGASLVFSCFDARERNAFAHDLPLAVLGAAAPTPPGYVPGPFAFAEPGFVATTLAAADWHDATPERIAFDYVVGEGADPVAAAADFLTRIGPLARVIADAPVSDRPRLTTHLTAALARYRLRDRVVLPASAWLWRARAGESA